jgi:hypothetical protein
MRFKNFTRRMTLICAIFLAAGYGLYAQDQGTGTGWNENYIPSEPMVLNEDFSHFEFYGNWQHTANSNSKPIVDEQTGETTPGLMSGEKTITYLESDVEHTYTWDSCAFAPEWGVAASVDQDTGDPLDPDPTTDGVSDGFVEVGRRGYGTLGGSFIIDLRKLDYLEGIQYSHSSTGGTRRGFILFYSKDDGQTWDTLRYQLGDHYSLNFTEDPFDGSRTPNDINCTPSANGMLWEEALYSTDKLMLKFEAANNIEPQAVRFHDFKVYGTLAESNAVGNIANLSDLKVYLNKNTLKVSKRSNVNVYSLAGSLVQSAINVERLNVSGLQRGVYIVKAQAGNKVTTQKIIKQ